MGHGMAGASRGRLACRTGRQLCVQGSTLNGALPQLTVWQCLARMIPRQGCNCPRCPRCPAVTHLGALRPVVRLAILRALLVCRQAGWGCSVQAGWACSVQAGRRAGGQAAGRRVSLQGIGELPASRGCKQGKAATGAAACSAPRPRKPQPSKQRVSPCTLCVQVHPALGRIFSHPVDRVCSFHRSISTHSPFHLRDSKAGGADQACAAASALGWPSLGLLPLTSRPTPRSGFTAASSPPALPPLMLPDIHVEVLVPARLRQGDRGTGAGLRSCNGQPLCARNPATPRTPHHSPCSPSPHLKLLSALAP